MMLFRVLFLVGVCLSIVIDLCLQDPRLLWEVYRVCRSCVVFVCSLFFGSAHGFRSFLCCFRLFLQVSN